MTWTRGKIKRMVCTTAAVIGWLMLIGTVGASDCGCISFGQSVCRVMVGSVLLLGGLYKGGYMA